MFTYRAVIRSVHDGDSFRADVDLGFGIHIDDMAFRMNGIDAPEMGTEEGRAARDWLRGHLPAGLRVTIATHKDQREKYGRMLADVWDNDTGDVYGDSINDLIVDAGHARPYSGGKR